MSNKVKYGIIGGVGVVVFIGAMAAIGSPSDPVVAPVDTATTTVTAKAEAPVKTTAPKPAPVLTPRDKFDAVILGSGSFNSDQLDPAESVAKSFCGLLDSGMTFTSAATMMNNIAADSNVTTQQVGVIIGAGVPTYCPEYQSDLDAFVAANS